MQVPRGGKFVPAPMPYFMRFNGADGMHAGYLPGYPASHGCVRMPQQYAIAFFNAVEVGTPVTVFGRTPVSRYYSGQPQRGSASAIRSIRVPSSASGQCGGDEGIRQFAVVCAVLSADVVEFRTGFRLRQRTLQQSGHCFRRLMVRAGCLGSARKLNQVRQNIKSLLALGIDQRILVVTIRAARHQSDQNLRPQRRLNLLSAQCRSFSPRPVSRDT